MTKAIPDTNIHNHQVHISYVVILFCKYKFTKINYINLEIFNFLLRYKVISLEFLYNEFYAVGQHVILHHNKL